MSITSDTCQSSMKIFRDAALEISNIGTPPVFQGVADTYAVSFVSLHLLTAAIALSILTTLAPLTQESHDCKMGIRRLMEMQSRLRARSVVAEQGLGILKKFMSLVLKKEMKEMLEFPRSTDEAAAAAEDEVDGSDNVNRASQDNRDKRTSGFDRQADIQTRAEACQIRSHIDGQPANLSPVESSTLLIPDSGPGAATTPGFNFYEDPVITQALLDFEQGTCHLFLSRHSSLSLLLSVGLCLIWSHNTQQLATHLMIRPKGQCFLPMPNLPMTVALTFRTKVGYVARIIILRCRQMFISRWKTALLVLPTQRNSCEFI